MKIVKWLTDSMSAIHGKAIIELEPGEVADFDEMVKLVDGDVGNFGVSITTGMMGWYPKRKSETRQFTVSVNRD